MTTEAKLEKRLTVWATQEGGTALKGATTFDTGYPDRIIYLQGVHAHVELKGTSTSYHLSAKQKIWAGRIIASRARYYIIENEKQLEMFKDNPNICRTVGRNEYSLNGFNLTFTYDSTGWYDVHSYKSGTRTHILSGTGATNAAKGIYKAFMHLEERFPLTNYCDI